MATAFVTVSDVQAQLNTTYDAAARVYSVYGLNIQEASLQAHVDYANTYINAFFTTDLAVSDPRYSAAKLAALDVACIRALVIATGGSLVGAYDYFLGDLRVSRAGPFATAIKSTIEGFKEDLLRQVTNVSTPVKTGDAQEAGKVPTYRGGGVSP